MKDSLRPSTRKGTIKAKLWLSFCKFIKNGKKLKYTIDKDLLASGASGSSRVHMSLVLRTVLRVQHKPFKTQIK